ncbi:hypothetical protein [Streptomyces sp. 5-6(2022)]|uniref:hypothetical protein n=1 Tax=Streptomyces sp. 5-6(2022) TaxID=2936510 RepID=UPI0023B9781A|nr:hypothetical protein [Streptomyces sp. 5-6(2022)]
MISKSGCYWSTGITVAWSPRARTINGQAHPGWKASAEKISTQGHLETRYFVTDTDIPSTPLRPGENLSGLTVAVDALITDAERLGIDFMSWSDQQPMLYYKGDGEDADYPAPEGWRDMLKAEAERIGWGTYT